MITVTCLNPFVQVFYSNLRGAKENETNRKTSLNPFVQVFYSNKALSVFSSGLYIRLNPFVQVFYSNKPSGV